jgi:electron transport complex protein RnfG
MKKLESTFANMLIVLLLIALISAGLLAATFEYTREDIAANQLAKQMAALDAVLPAYDNDLLADQTEYEGYQLFPAYLDGELVGAAVLGLSARAFSGEMEVMAGFAPDGTLINAIAVRHAETPGLGSKVNDDAFASQFRGLKLSAGEVLTVSKDGGAIDAVTAATISSRAYCDAVSLAWESAATFFGGAR